MLAPVFDSRSMSIPSCVCTTRQTTVIVDVYDLAIADDPLRDLMHVVRCRQPGAYVNELSDPGFFHQVPYDSAEHGSLRPDPDLGRRHRRDDPVSDRAVNGVIVFAVEQIIVDAGDVRMRRVQRREG